MFDAAAPVLPLQRTHGRAHVAIAGRRLTHLHQEGAAKAMLPRMHGRVPELVFLNTAGGVTGGDRLQYEVDLGADSAAVVTTQTAERAYRSAGGRARVATRLTLGPGAVLHWLPQELILFDGAALERDFQVDMAADATLIALETLVLGRAAMGEVLARVDLRDHRAVRRAGRLMMVEPVRLNTADLTRAGCAGLNGAGALASLTMIAPGAEDRLAALRRVLPAEGVVAAASAWGGRITARFMATDAYPLRRAVGRAIEVLSGQPLPRVWQM
ncbi:urease accessory protein UreD [Rhodophyticola sp. CCM32]|uniref:urease accessory protein UreD n=1 Tax=Rhodophyticola sp. CCM32 TaxID=2916397 RepID=UPI00107F5F48|nr:urease accessory protein UreD [Rhodophyticola sp. CCM32]QBX99763.1 urease accessory protein UreD [Rhodophyticola sp. CCM32]